MKKKSTDGVAPTPAKRGRKPKTVSADSSAAPSISAKRGRKTKSDATTPPAIPDQSTAKPDVNHQSNQTGQATLLVVRHNAGWGNALFLRGEGPGLSWSTGLALACIGDNEWIWSANLTAPILFKVLRNDKTWSTGDNLVLAPGDSLTVTPTFA